MDLTLHKSVTDSIDRHNQRDSFILRLPDEILVHIVCLTQDQLDVIHLWPPALNMRTQLEIMRVCTRLHRLVMGSPQLWACIEMRCPMIPTWTHVKHASNFPLDFITDIDDETIAQRAIDLLERIRAAVLMVYQPEDQNERERWSPRCQQLFSTPATLRSLVVNADPGGNLEP